MADPWLATAILMHQYASNSSSPFIWAFIPEHFYYWALLHSSVSGCSVIWGGRPQRHWSISAPSALSPYFPSSFLFLCYHPFFWTLFISFAHLARPQTNTCRHTYYAHINCGLSHTWIRVHAHMLFCFHYFKGHCISLDFHFLNAYCNPTYRTTWLTLNIPVILT